MNSFIKDTSTQDQAIATGPLRRRRLWLISVAFAGCCLLGYGVFSLSATLGADRIVYAGELRTGTVVRGDLVRDITAQGRVVVANSPTLFSSEQGRVKLLIKAGDPVHEGQVLAVINSPELGELLARERSVLAQLKAELERQKIEARTVQLARSQALALAEVQLKAMQREKRRADNSFALHLISELDYEEIVDNLERARLEQVQAHQNVELAQDSLAFYDQSLQLQSEGQQLIIQALERRIDELTIVSPVEGMVGNVEVNQQQAVTANQPLISVVDLTAYEIEASVAEGMAAELVPGMDASVGLNGDQYAGVVTAISPEVVAGQVTVRIRFVDDLPASLRQNQRLTTRILLENRPDTLMVERGPYFDAYPGHVFKLTGERAQRTAAVLGARSLRHIEVMEGLAEGDTVIISALDVASDAKDLLVTN